jgi:gliding motility-associated-like protein
VPLNSKVYKNGGINGVILADSNNPWGATAGSDGVVISNLSIPIDSVLFAPNIDSVGITDSFNCNNFYFKGFAHTNTRPITSWKWYFGDGDSGIVQNPLHTYLSAGTFTVQLIVTDANGCQDSASVNVNSYILNITAGPPKTICANSSTVLQATNNGGTQFAWSPAQYLNDSTLLNPIAAPPATTMYHLVAASGSGCTKTDSVLITVHSPGIFAVNPPANICQNDSIQLLASGGDVYLWNPGNLTVSNPVVSPLVTTTYSVRISDTACHVNGNLSTTISVLQLPLVLASKSNDIDCGFDFSQLNATGAVSYVWSPASSLSNPLIANPIAKPAFQTLYTVKGKGANGCVRSDTITVYIKGIGDAGYKMPSAFTPNGDGLNDCYGIKYWGLIQELDFSIYNRWGQRVFHTKTPGDCWDGTFKGEKQNPDVFVYIINAKTNCGKIFRKGTFLLIR